MKNHSQKRTTVHAEPVNADAEPVSTKKSKYFLLFRDSGVVIPDIANTSVFNNLGIDYVRFSAEHMASLLETDIARIVLFLNGVSTAGMADSRVVDDYTALGLEYNPELLWMELTYNFQGKRGRKTAVKTAEPLVVDGRLTNAGFDLFEGIFNKLRTIELDITDIFSENRFEQLNAAREEFNSAVYKIGLELGFAKRRGRKGK